MNKANNNKFDWKKTVEDIIFSTKWILIPFYLGLILALCVYLIHFCYQLFLMFYEFKIIDANSIMMCVLQLVDITMIANLIKMIISGSYTSFVNKFHKQQGEQASSGMLKVKMTTSLALVTSIHLLQTFLVAKDTDWESLKKQVFIHCVFLVGALILAIVEYLHVKTDKVESKIESKTHNEEIH